MDIKKLETFLSVVRHRNFAAAGESVGLSRSGVSIQISALEDEFDIKLFDRKFRPPQLTPEGHAFLNNARDLVAVWSRMNGRGGRHETTGTLHLGAVQTVVAGILPYAIKRFQIQQPDVRINVQTGLADELDAMLRRGTLDAVIQPQSDNIHPGLTWQTFCQEPLMIVAPAALEGLTDAELLSKLPFIRYRRIAWGLGRTIEQEFSRRGIDVVTLAEVDSIEAAFELVKNGLGTAVVPQRRIPEPFPDLVKTVAFGDPPLSRTLGVLWREEGDASFLVRELYQSLVATAEDFAKVR